MNPDLPPKERDRRRAPRIPMGIPILIPHLQKKLLCHDLSKKGCFFLDSDLGPVGQTFSVTIDLPEIGMIPVEAKVVHKGEDGKGTGLFFVGFDPADADKLASFLDIFQDS